ncbi:hypothetical protein IAQ61_000058 [Plenodomus lingam]|uniref:uncharacterized protein n=1 Tax=Leptosphaeria maculans TaxID=5022 RepID=UPI00333306C8|nr:hypothetical protein IAQ61_000058 [Plenodomus lingam]
MGIPIGWNIKRDEPKGKDVLRADLSGQRSPIRRRARPHRSPSSHTASDSDFLVFPSRRGGAQPEVFARPSHARTRLAPPPVPEVSRTDYRSNSSSSNNPNESSREPPTLQRDESAIHNYTRAGAPRLMRSWNARADSATRGDTPDGFEDAHDNGDNNAVGFPPLRRMGRRTIADGPLPSSSLRESWTPVSTLDGLGDRDRSISPLDDHPPWHAFLGSVVPDPVAPTAESSFASAAASASFSNSHPSSRAGSSNSATSSQTHLTVPSRRDSLPHNEQFLRACDTSEDGTASDTEEDEPADRAQQLALAQYRHQHQIHLDQGMARRRRIDAAESRRRMRPSYFSNEPPMRDSERYSRRVLERSRDASAYVRSFYHLPAPASHTNDESTHIEQLDGPAEEQPSAPEDDTVALGSLLDQQLRDARSLLERISRRADISDDFWASVGLSRSFADPVERFQERERH